MLAYKFSGKIIRFYVVHIGWFFMIADICANLNFRCDVIYEYRHMFLTGACHRGHYGDCYVVWHNFWARLAR